MALGEAADARGGKGLDRACGDRVDSDAVLAEVRRVLRPGGVLAVLEFGLPSWQPARFFHRLYTERIMPFTATLVARDRSGAIVLGCAGMASLCHALQQRLGVPVIGYDHGGTAEILREAGFNDSEIAGLRDAKAVFIP